MNLINELFQSRGGNILSVYFTAGYPSSDSTIQIIKDLADAGADMIEIGMPFSDPLADGPVIQKSSREALNNGMNLNLLFRQLTDIRREVSVPLLFMGYINPVLKFGMEDFCSRCASVGIDGVIIPDLPPELFLEEYSSLFDKYNLFNILMISPQTDEKRIRIIDEISKGFIYMVSSSSTTGVKEGFSDDQKSYFKRVNEMGLKNPRLTGFGISDNRTFKTACTMADGAIIGSAFINMLDESGHSPENISRFVKRIRKGI